MQSTDTSLAQTAIMFSGQGTQFVRMGTADPIRQTLYKADAVLGYSLSSLCIHGPAELLNSTRYAQPAVYAVSYALHNYLLGKRGLPFCFAGHSLGEYTALAASGAVTFEEGLLLVDRRAQAMSQCTGGMTALIGMSEDEIRDLLSSLAIPDLWIANINTDTQIVISGSIQALEVAEDAIEQMPGHQTFRRLAVGSACHSPLMQPAEAALSTAIEKAHLCRPHAPILCSTTNQLCHDPYLIANNLRKQLVSPLHWADSVRKLTSLGISHLIEIGPRSVLKGLVRRLVDIDCTAYTERDLR